MISQACARDETDAPLMFERWVIAKLVQEHQLQPSHFRRETVAMPELREGEALVRIKLINVHSATQLRIEQGLTPLGETDPRNFACAQVVASKDPTFAVGDTVACQSDWQQYQVISSHSLPIGFNEPGPRVKVLNGTCSPWNYVFRPHLVKRWPSDVLMDVFGTSGLLAWFGMRENGPLQPGETVAVGAVSGSVGSMVAQLAKAAGCKVVGFASGRERCVQLTQTLGIDGCIDYHNEHFDDELRAIFPQGIDVFSDGVGGSFTERLVPLIKPGGRLFSYGAAAAAYAGNASEGPRTTPTIREHYGISAVVEQLLKDRSVRSGAWTVDHFYHERLQAEDALSRLLEDGRLRPHNHVVQGFERLPNAIVDLYHQPRNGKLQISFEQQQEDV